MYIPKCFDPQGTIFRELYRIQCRTKTNQPFFTQLTWCKNSQIFLWRHFSFRCVFPKRNSRFPYKRGFRIVVWFKNKIATFVQILSKLIHTNRAAIFWVVRQRL